MEASVAALLLVVSSVVLACIVVDYAVTVFEQTLNSQDLPLMNGIRGLQSSLLNQTNAFLNQTQSVIGDAPEP